MHPEHSRPLPAAALLAIAATVSLMLVVGTAGAARAAEGPVTLGARGVSNFVAKAEAGEALHVAFLGGSITQKADGHSAMFADWLRERWPAAEFRFTNAGLSSTCSVSGAFRIRKEVLSEGPVDLLVVEFAVNDDQDAAHDYDTAVRGFEGIVRQHLEANPEGDAIVVQFVNPEILERKLAGEPSSSIEAHRAVARHYGLPEVDVARALADEIAAGRMSWEEDYRDTHPNETGYRFATALIAEAVERTAAELPAASVVERDLPEPLDPLSYSRAKAVDPQEFAWLGGWRFEPVGPDLLPEGSIRKDYEGRPALRGDEAGDYLYHTFLGSKIGAFILAGPDAGVLEISIDGGEWFPVDLYHRHSAGLNYPRSVIFADGLSPAYHLIAIRVSEERNPESRGNAATILQFQVNE